MLWEGERRRRKQSNQLKGGEQALKEAGEEAREEKKRISQRIKPEYEKRRAVKGKIL